jgi:hypothetical protein
MEKQNLKCDKKIRILSIITSSKKKFKERWRKTNSLPAAL